MNEWSNGLVINELREKPSNIVGPAGDDGTIYRENGCRTKQKKRVILD